MPQTSPMNWILISVTLMMIFSSILSMIYMSKNHKKMNMIITKKTMNWKW